MRDMVGGASGTAAPSGAQRHVGIQQRSGGRGANG